MKNMMDDTEVTGITKAAGFTMSSGYGYEGQGFSWINDGILVEDCQTPRQIAQFVRDYVKTVISEQNNSNASNATVYKVWRCGYEFDMLCDHVAGYVAGYVENQYE